jgi:excisionase family DNA binding protein
MAEWTQEIVNNPMTGKGLLIAATMLEKELAEALGLPLGTVRRLRYEGEIPYVMIGRGRPIYLAESIIAWLKRKEVSDSDGTDTIEGLYIPNKGVPEP